MFSSFGNSSGGDGGDGISFDDFFGFSSEDTLTVATTLIEQTVNNQSDKKQQPPLKKTLPPLVTKQKSPERKIISSDEDSDEESEESSDEEEEESSEQNSDEEMKQHVHSSSSSSGDDNNSSSSSDEERVVTSSKKPATLVGKLANQKIAEKNKETPKQSIHVSSSRRNIVEQDWEKQKKSSSPPLKEKRLKEKETPKRKLVQTKLDKSMFEKRVEQPSTDSSLFCMCCNTFIPLTVTSSNNLAKRVKNASRYEEWNEHVESDEHLLRKDRLSRLNVLCFMSSSENKRFHHFVNSFCLMFFHRLETLAVEFSKKKRKKKFNIDDCEDYLILDYVINFIYARVGNLEYTLDYEKILKRFLNNVRQNSLKMATILWQQYKDFYVKMSDDDFGYLLTEIVHRAWDCLRHLAYFGSTQDPIKIFIEEPFEFEDYFRKEEESEENQSDSTSEDENSEDDDIFNAQHPYFETFMKMYIQQFMFLKPIEKIMNEAVEEYRTILSEEIDFNEWKGIIMKRKSQFLSKSQQTSTTDDTSSEEEVVSPTIPPPKLQAPKQKSIEDLLFGSAANNTFESFFSTNVTPKKPAIQQIQSKKKSTISNENESMTDEEMWSLLRQENMQ